MSNLENVKINENNENYPEPGVGPTPELNLRVSTAVLANTFFIDPISGKQQLVLERKATYDKKTCKISLKAQPLGGASTLKKPKKLLEAINQFNYDEQKSKDNQDFRIYIKPEDWNRENGVKEFCLKHFQNPIAGVLEANIQRELSEELTDSLNLEIDLENSLEIENLGPQVQSEPQITDRTDVKGSATVRVFNIQEVKIVNQDLISAIKENSTTSNTNLCNQVNEKNKKATALIAFDYDELKNFLKQNNLTEGSFVYRGIKIADNVLVALRGDLSR